MFNMPTRLVSLVLAGALTLLCVADGTNAQRATKPSIPNGHWVDTWVSMPQLTEPANLPPAPFVRLV